MLNGMMIILGMINQIMDVDVDEMDQLQEIV
jgi:hypothetical protein